MKSVETLIQTVAQSYHGHKLNRDELIALAEGGDFLQWKEHWHETAKPQH